MEDVDDIHEEEFAQQKIDPFEEAAFEDVEKLFNNNKERVFYSRQIEVMFEGKYFHWVTNRVLRFLAAKRTIGTEVRNFAWGGSITLYWNNSYRYYKRDALKVMKIVERYSADIVNSSVGRHGELLVVEGFAKFQFINLGRDVNKYRDKKWVETNHNLDMVIERDGIAYGVEVKNTLGYIQKGEFDLKIEMCKYLGIRPVFAVRMLPKDWINELIHKGGFALLMGYLLYPELLHELALTMEKELGLPVKCPRSLYEGTIKRFENWHVNNVNRI